jgi:voltage-gated potassium channel
MAERTGTPSSALEAELAPFLKRMAILLGMVVLLVGGATIAFTITSNDDLWEAFQLSLDTVATVGSIPTPQDTGSEIVSVILIVLGVGTLLYALVTVTEFFVAGHLGELLAERRAQKMTDALSDHYIVCGYGRVGRQVAADLRAAGARYVVIDRDPRLRERVHEVGVRAIVGSPSDDEILRGAGIDRARAIIACVDSDAENIFTTLTARELRPDIAIVARASEEDSGKKLKRAGADRVISPYQSSGTEMARLALHPQVTGTMSVDDEYRMEEIAVTKGAPGEGKTVADIRGGAFIVAIRTQAGEFQASPPPDTVLAQGDTVMAIGTSRTLTRLEELFDPAGGPSA